MRFFSSTFRLSLSSLMTLPLAYGMEIPETDVKSVEITGFEVLNDLTLHPEDMDNSASVRFKGGIINGAGPGKVINCEQLREALQSKPDLKSLKLTPKNLSERDKKYIFTKSVIETIFSAAPQLISLDIQNNTLSYVGAECLFQHAQTSKTLKVLILSNTDLGKNSSFIRASLDPSESSSFGSQPGEESDVNVGEALMEIQKVAMSDEPMKRIHLDETSDTNNRYIDCLINCLTLNTRLTFLGLSHNNLSTSDFEKMLPLLEDIMSPLSKKREPSALKIDLTHNKIQLTQPSHFEPKRVWSTSNFLESIDIRDQRNNDNCDEECIIL